MLPFKPLKRIKSNNRCPECSSAKIKPKHSSLEEKFMKPYMSAKLSLDLKKDRKCENCGYGWIEKTA